MAAEKKRISFETIASVVAVIVGVAAVFIAWDEARSVRKQQASSVLPVLEIRTININNEEGSVSSIMVENVGVGPAFVERADIIWNGEIIGGTEDLRQILDDGSAPFGFWTARLDGEILAGGEEYNLFSATLGTSPDSNEQTSVLRRKLYSNVGVVACFCSVYEDCWETTLNKRYRPERVKYCRRKDAS
mgnify:CR=1 FL=1|jgi:hypothetical protein